MAEYVFKLPDLGEGIAESEIAEWRVAEGDTVTEDQPLVDMLTEKAAVEIPSPVTGKIQRLHGNVGDQVPVGAALITFVIDSTVDPSAPPPPVEKTKAEASASAPAPESLPQKTVPPSPGPGTARVAAAPTVRKRAREQGIDLSDVHGSGPGGRILHQDLEAHLEALHSPNAPTAKPAAGPRAPAEEIETIPVIGLRRRIAETLQRTAQRVPHFSYVEEVDVTELEALRGALNEEHAEAGRLTILPLLIQALVRALAKFPEVNATYDDEKSVVLRYRSIHVGVATHTSSGLLVPVLRDAQTLDLWTRAQRIRELAELTRSGKATRDQLTGSTITITSLGALGGIASTPILNAPEVAIIGVNKVVERPMMLGGKVEPRRMMNLSSSFDHRIIDGHVAASFIQQMKRLLESPTMLFIDPPR
jgi:2-oxoisovalerate dehydrogenase E2 component (dihydrolipoyl transacylase)